MKIVILTALTHLAIYGCAAIEAPVVIVPSIDSPTNVICFVNGPYETEMQTKPISNKLRTLGAVTSYRKEVVRIPTTFLAYLPKYDTSELARKKYIELEEKGFGIILVKEKERLVNAISLGEFDTEIAAKSLLKKLRVNELAPKIHTEYTLNDRYWINIGVNSRDTYAVNIIKSLNAGLKVLEFTEIECNKYLKEKITQEAVQGLL